MSHPSTRLAIPALCVAMVLAVTMTAAGCSTDTAGAPPATAPAGSVPSGTASDAPDRPASAPGPKADLATTTFPVDLNRAIAVAGRTAPGATITKIGLEYDTTLSAWVWKVDAQNGSDQHELKIDTASAKVVADERDQESAHPTAVNATTLAPAEALRRATAVVPGSVASWDLEFDDGSQRYKVEVRAPGGETHDAAVDVDTGRATRG